MFIDVRDSVNRWISLSCKGQIDIAVSASICFLSVISYSIDLMTLLCWLVKLSMLICQNHSGGVGMADSYVLLVFREAWEGYFCSHSLPPRHRSTPNIKEIWKQIFSWGPGRSEGYGNWLGDATTMLPLYTFSRWGNICLSPRVQIP